MITEYTIDEFLKKEKVIKENYWRNNSFYDKYGNSYSLVYKADRGGFCEVIEDRSKYWGNTQYIKCTLEEFFNKVHPVHLDTYLVNGRFYERRY